MLKYLIKSTNEVRLETMSEVEAFHKKLQEEAEKGGWTLGSFSWTEKSKAVKGEVVDEWFIVKYTNVFNDAKNPERPYTNIEYNLTNFGDVENV